MFKSSINIYKKVNIRINIIFRFSYLAVDKVKLKYLTDISSCSQGTL